ncbi:putative metallopeptidase [Robbsia andropogonis]|uniref:putative metallopeptidase n=1 Tax=Robbsia andropogonis TaxID=28092 RepID=UPI003D2049F0
MARKKTPVIQAIRNRPMPPAQLMDPDNWSAPYAPAPEVTTWLHDTFIDEISPLYNEDHRHLADETIFVLWAGEGWTRQMEQVAGCAEIVTFRASAWQKGRQEQQMREWFGEVPQYLITLDAHYALKATDAQWCALVEHELYHFGQEKDAFGQPAFKADGSPKIGMRAHDVNEFVGIVRRYGAGNAAGQTMKLIEAARSAPQVCDADISSVCGSCNARIG